MSESTDRMEQLIAYIKDPIVRRQFEERLFLLKNKEQILEAYIDQILMAEHIQAVDINSSATAATNS